MILAGDIGGTKTVLGLFESPAEGRRTLRTATYPSRDHSHLESVLAAFLGSEERAIEHACLGIAGPVIDNRVKTSNLPWTVDGAEIARAFSIPRVELINDLVAMGEGIATLAPGDFAVLQEGIPDDAGQAALVAPGTGLGIAILQRAEAGLVPLPSEGGHADFSAQSDDEIELLRSLRGRFGQVCSEHVVSGPGLVNVYRHLRDRAPEEESAELREAMAARDPAEVIGTWGTTGKSPLCAQAIDLFVRAWGRLAGNVALIALATGGVYLGGGIAPRYLELLEDGRFLAAFRDKGSYAPLLERIPVRVILEPMTPLRGAARRAQRALGG
jgi:glucokinase